MSPSRIGSMQHRVLSVLSRSKWMSVLDITKAINKTDPEIARDRVASAMQGLRSRGIVEFKQEGTAAKAPYLYRRKR
jgi:hypothetical protein